MGTWKTRLLHWSFITSEGDLPLLAVRLIELMDDFRMTTGLDCFAVALTNVVFAVDSVPAFSAVSRDRRHLRRPTLPSGANVWTRRWDSTRKEVVPGQGEGGDRQWKR